MSRAHLRTLKTIAHLYDPRQRYLHMRLELRTTAGRRLLSGGGVWDKLERRWVTPLHMTVLQESELATADESKIGRAHILTVEDSQIEYVLNFGQWLYAFLHDLPRPAFVDVLAGKRRGGKTWVMVACIVLAAVAVPQRVQKDGNVLGFVCWLVVPGYPEQREIHEDVMAVLATRRDLASRETADVLSKLPGSWRSETDSWWMYRPTPRNCYQFAHGSELYLKSANRAESLKQGRVDLVGINEAQKVDGEAAIHSAGNTLDTGGLTILACNPPRRSRGAWVLEIKFAVDEKRVTDPADGKPVVRWFTVDPEKNARINQASRGKYRIFAGTINPKLANADADAEWNQLQDVVFYKFGQDNVIPSVPPTWKPCTGEVIAAMRLRDNIRHPTTYTSFGGMDFNKSPWYAVLGLKAYRVPERADQLVYVVDREYRNDPDGEQGRTEREVIVELWRKGWDPLEVVIIADPSGQWQNSESRQRGGVSAGHSSFDLFRSETIAEQDGETATIPAWDMHAPTTWKAKDSKHYAHPRKVETIDEINELFRTARLYVLADCKHLIEACKKAPGDPHERGVTKNLRDLWHIIDALRYPIHRAQSAMEPKHKPRRDGPTTKAPTTSQKRGPLGGQRLGGARRFAG